MTVLWVPWELGAAATLFAALVFSVVLSVPLGAAAWRLPRRLDDALPTDPTVTHRTCQRAFWLAVPLLSMVCAWRFGPTGVALVAIVFVSVLLTLAWIDAETGFLPDALTLPLLWLGLLVNIDEAFAPLSQAVLGAAIGYLAFWGIDWLFRVLRGRSALGRGDFKFLAALGAWLGWAALPRIVLLAASLGLVVALGRRLAGQLGPGETFSFGPFLAMAGVAALLGA